MCITARARAIPIVYKHPPLHSSSTPGWCSTGVSHSYSPLLVLGHLQLPLTQVCPKPGRLSGQVFPQRPQVLTEVRFASQPSASRLLQSASPAGRQAGSGFNRPFAQSEPNAQQCTQNQRGHACIPPVLHTQLNAPARFTQACEVWHLFPHDAQFWVVPSTVAPPACQGGSTDMPA